MMESKFALSILLIFFCSCQKDSTDIGYDDMLDIVQQYSEQDIVPGWIRIKLSEEMEDYVPRVTTRGTVESGISSIDRVAASLGAVSVERVFKDGGRFQERRRQAGLHLWYDIKIDDEIPVTRAVKEFSELPEIEVVSPVFRYTLLNAPDYRHLIYDNGPGEYIPMSLGRSFDDPNLDRQWHYFNDGSVDHSLEGADINLFYAWNFTTGSSDIVVAVIDGAIDTAHPDLVDNLWTAQWSDPDYPGVVHGWNARTKSAVLEPNDHGTHIAGTIGAVNNNGTGVSGIAGGSGNSDGIKLMSVQIFEGGSTVNQGQNAPEALTFATDFGASIVNCSFGSIGDDPALRAAVNYFVMYAGLDENGNQTAKMRGGLVIAAAGNDNKRQTQYPAGYSSVVAVAAMGPDFVRSGYSNYGSWVDITAPGGTTARYGDYSDNNMVYSTVRSTAGSYNYMAGTSMACPHVVGVAALALSVHGGPGYTSDQLRAKIVDSTQDIYYYSDNSRYSSNLGSGYIDAGKAVTTDKGTAPEKVSSLAVTENGESVNLTWTVTKDQNDLAVSFYNIYYKLTPFGDDPLSGEMDMIRVPNRRETGATRTQSIPLENMNLSRYFAIEAMDLYGNVSELTYGFYDSGNSFNTPPVVVDPVGNLFINGIGESYSIEIDSNEIFSDSDEYDQLVFGADTDSDIIRFDWNEDVITIIPLKEGVATVDLWATDLAGNKTTDTFTVTVSLFAGDFQVYPSVFTDKVNYRVGPKFAGEGNLSIYNNAGQRVYNTDGPFAAAVPVEISLGNLPSGQYTAVIKVGKEQSDQRIVKR